MSTIKNQITEIEQFIELGPKKNETFSQVDSYWQLDHALRVIHGISQALANSNPEEYQPKFSFLKLMIMTLKRIPRGKGRAPKHVLPEDHISKIDLIDRLGSAQSGSDSIYKLDPNCYFNHPLFGHLNVAASQKFLWIHTEHHLKIVRDIVGK